MHFYKYQGAGNDFVMIDQRSQQWISRADRQQVEQLCNRRFGIGADGLILLENCPGYDFEMIYFNSDGRESTMCGNGGRCIVAFAHDLGLVQDQCRFKAIDGDHVAYINSPGPFQEAWVSLQMSDVRKMERLDQAYVLNTGSPHYVLFKDQIDQMDAVAEGRAIRNSEPFKKEGINVNFVCWRDASDGRKGLAIRTYERGVEDETLACGTGVTAAVLAAWKEDGLGPGRYELPVNASGGAMRVRFEAHDDGHFSDIWLCGPAAFVFDGKIRE